MDALNVSHKFGEFYALPIKLGTDSSVIRFLFIKKHEGKEGDVKPSDRTLFIVNVPQCLNKKCLKYILKNTGGIEKIFIHSKPKGIEETAKSEQSKYFSNQESILGAKVAYVVFKNPASLKKVLKLRNADVLSVPIDLFRSNIGKNKWSREYNSQFIDPDDLQKEIESYMSEYDKKIEDEKEKCKQMDGVADEEGWITVTRHSRKPKIPRSEAVGKKILDKNNRGQAKKTLLNFYRSQLRDAKMQQIEELRKKFERDKERIALMRANRKFKPF
ncbi:Ribosomal RNA-processing protein 7-like protein, partial [Stegodyphus mimosarum]